MTVASYLVREARQSDAASVVAWFASREEAILWAGNDLPAQVDAGWLAGEIAAPEQRYRVFAEPEDGRSLPFTGSASSLPKGVPIFVGSQSIRGAVAWG